MTQFLKKRASDFLGLHEVQWMVARQKEMYPALVAEVTPKPVSPLLLTEVLQRLADEGVSIRDLKSIFEALAKWGLSRKRSASSWPVANRHYTFTSWIRKSRRCSAVP